MRVAVAQLNPTVGALVSNREAVLKAWNTAKDAGADVVVVPELVLSGYPPEDLVLKPAFQDAVRGSLHTLAKKTARGPALIVGAPWRDDASKALWNAALLLEGGTVRAVYGKRLLPTYGPFDEKRVYTPGPSPHPFTLQSGEKVGVMICEDMWTPEVATALKAEGASVLMALNASPFEEGKPALRLRVARARTRETNLPLVYVNQVGGQDELVFDGASFVLDGGGTPVARLAAWAEDLTVVDITKATPPQSDEAEPPDDADGAMYQALVIAVRDYARKNGFKRTLLGLSGGVDSALVAALAVDALGPAGARFVMMPSPYTAPISLEGAESVAQTLGVVLETMPIDPLHQQFLDTLVPLRPLPRRSGLVEENLQARIRGTLLMALSNADGSLVLATGNKSELAVGYSTLYGDLCGGFAPLKDVYKTRVYRLARWRNAQVPPGALGPPGPVIPDIILERPPSAELRPQQTDQDTLPPYDTLDGILEGLIEDDVDAGTLVARGFARTLVEDVTTKLYRAEYKRRQAPPGPKVTRRHLGRDRRYPVTQGFVSR